MRRARSGATLPPWPIHAVAARALLRFEKLFAAAGVAAGKIRRLRACHRQGQHGHSPKYVHIRSLSVIGYVPTVASDAIVLALALWFIHRLDTFPAMAAAGRRTSCNRPSPREQSNNAERGSDPDTPQPPR